jgi:predicted nucleic acid-binding protein
MTPEFERRLQRDFLIDTNVLIYATLTSDPRFARAREVLEARLKQPNRAFVSAQNLAEMYPNLTGPRTQPPDSPELAAEKIAAIWRLRGLIVLPVTMHVVDRALTLCRDHHVTRQRYFDMQLVASMQIHGIPTIVTENEADFSGIEGVSVVNPFAVGKSGKAETGS